MPALRQTTTYGVFQLGLLAESPSLAIVRKLTKGAVRSWSLAHLLEGAVVIINELGTNALAAAPGKWIEIRLTLDPEGVLLECWDPSPDLPLANGIFCEDAEGGRGLRIVAALATRHGVTRDPNREGKTVWAILGPDPESTFA